MEKPNKDAATSKADNELVYNLGKTQTMFSLIAEWPQGKPHLLYSSFFFDVFYCQRIVHPDHSITPEGVLFSNQYIRLRFADVEEIRTACKRILEILPEKPYGPEWRKR